ncbi:hypothetical protein ACHWQZ_G007015 [Mnemiopsis leidyi]
MNDLSVAEGNLHRSDFLILGLQSNPNSMKTRCDGELQCKYQIISTTHDGAVTFQRRLVRELIVRRLESTINWYKMSAQDRHIPILDEETDYSTWKKKVEIWKLGTNSKPNQQAAAGHHSQTTSGRIKPSITTIPSTIRTQVKGTGFTKDPTSREGAKDQPT